MLGSIRNQLTLIICSLMALTLISALLISYYLVATDYQGKMQQTNAVMAESLGTNIRQVMENAYNINEFMARDYNMVNFDHEEQRQLLIRVTHQHSFFQLLAVHKLNGDQTARSQGVLGNRAERWWFKKFMQDEKPYISKTYYSLTAESPITTIVHGIYKNGILTGVLMNDIAIKNLQQMVEAYNSGAGSYAYLLDGEGGVIAHPDHKQVAELYNYKTMKKSILRRDADGKVVMDAQNNEEIEESEISITPSLQNIVAKVMAGETGVGEYTDLNGYENICAYRVISLPGQSDPWRLIVVQKKTAALSFMNHMVITNLVVGLLVIMLGVLLTFFFARRISDSLQEIINVTNRIKNGELSARLTVRFSNEMDMLVINFNQMVVQLQQHREGLEGLVEERAGELGAANEELTAMNEEMLAMNETLEDANQQLADENKARQQIEDDLLLRERQYRVATSLLTRPVDEFEGLMEAVLRDALQLVKAPHGYIGLYDDSGEVFLVHHGVGVYEALIMELQSVKTGMQEYVYRTGEIFWVNDYQTYSKRTNDKRLEGVTSAIMLPLKQEGQVKGILCASWNEVVHTISTEDVEVLRQFCDLASIALERTNAQKKIRQMAFCDMLTGLPNRVSLNLYIEGEMKKVHSGGVMGVVLVIDIDDLKSVNDNFGHSFGDSVIIAASKHIVQAVGEKGFVARSGGDEFIVVLSGEYNREEAAKIADKVLDALSQEYEVSVEYLHMSASIGVVLYPEDGNQAEDILKKADSAMHVAKRTGGKCWKFYEPVFLQEALEKMMLTNALHRALERGELFLHYQPQLSARGNEVIGFEALLRWNSSEYGFISPDRFIPLAEKSGLILPIGQWVLEEACRFARRLADMGKGNIHVAVNISPRQLMADNFVDIVSMSIEEAGIEPKQLEIEITESVLIESIEDIVHQLGELRDVGLMLSLDDFGTGYSSLTYLRSLPVGVLKIDKSFIDNIVLDEIQMQLVGSIIDLGHALGLIIVAEGVETADQLTLLRKFHCDYIQGYIFSKPISEEDAIQFIM